MYRFVGIIKDRQLIVGYVLSNNGELKYFSKDCAIQIGLNGLIKDAYVNNSNIHGTRLLHKYKGNRSLRVTSLNELKNMGIDLIDKIPSNDIRFNTIKAVGCIFDGFGVVRGLRIINNGESNSILNLRVEDINSTLALSGKRIYGIRKVFNSKDIDNYYKVYYRCDFKETMMYGGTLTFGVQLVTPYMNIGLANRLFGSENNIAYNKHLAESFDVVCRQEVIKTARQIEYNMLVNNSMYNFQIEHCDVIANAKIYDLISCKFLVQELLVLRVPRLGYVVSRNIWDKRIEGVPQITLYKHAVLYSLPYRDGNKLIIAGNSIRKQIRENILDARLNHNLTIEKYVESYL